MNAFPIPELLQDRDGNYRIDCEGGLTKRELFAAMAMQGLLSNSGGPFQANGVNGWSIVNCTQHDIASDCIAMADALLAELAKDGAA